MSASRRDRLHQQRERLRTQLRAQVAAQREAVRARLRKGRRPEPRRDRRWIWLVGLLLLLLLLWRGCRCEPEAPPAPPAPAATGLVGPPAPAILPPPAPPPPVPRRDRPAYAAEPQPAIPWLVSFRLQVAARSQRLAGCFVGSDRPGRLRWTASVEPGSGRVSDAEIEPTAGGAELTAAQRDCVLAVLADPPYRLADGEAAGEGRATPSRIGLVLEF